MRRTSSRCVLPQREDRADHQIKAENLPQQASPGSNTSQRKTRLSTGSSSDDDSKRLRGFQHIIQELSAENAEVKDKYQAVLEEVALLKEVRTGRLCSS